jgi:serine/threonine protein kinase
MFHSSPVTQTFQVSDFGVSILVHDVPTAEIAGAPRFQAPELKSQKYGTSLDVWSFGILIGELCKPPGFVRSDFSEFLKFPEPQIPPGMVSGDFSSGYFTDSNFWGPVIGEDPRFAQFFASSDIFGVPENKPPEPKIQIEPKFGSSEFLEFLDNKFPEPDPDSEDNDWMYECGNKHINGTKAFRREAIFKILIREGEEERAEGMEEGGEGKEREGMDEQEGGEEGRAGGREGKEAGKEGRDKLLRKEGGTLSELAIFGIHGNSDLMFLVTLAMQCLQLSPKERPSFQKISSEFEPVQKKKIDIQFLEQVVAENRKLL